MVKFANTIKVLPHDGVPCKMVIVNYFSRLMWLMMGSWSDLNIWNSDYITRDAFLAAVQTKFDADFVVDQVICSRRPLASVETPEVRPVAWLETLL